MSVRLRVFTLHRKTWGQETSLGQGLLIHIKSASDRISKKHDVNMNVIIEGREKSHVMNMGRLSIVKELSR